MSSQDAECDWCGNNEHLIKEGGSAHNPAEQELVNLKSDLMIHHF